MPKVQGASNSLVKIKVVKHDIERVERSYGGKSKCESSRKRSLPIKTGDVLERKKSTMRNPIKKVRFNLLHSNPEEPRPSGSRGEEHENATLVAHFNKSLNLDIPGCSKDGRTPGPSAAHAIVRLDSDNDDIISSTAEIVTSDGWNEYMKNDPHPKRLAELFEKGIGKKFNTTETPTMVKIEPIDDTSKANDIKKTPGAFRDKAKHELASRYLAMVQATQSDELDNDVGSGGSYGVIKIKKERIATEFYVDSISNLREMREKGTKMLDEMHSSLDKLKRGWKDQVKLANTYAVLMEAKKMMLEIRLKTSGLI
ncbi:uncharacterized protein LOC124168160 isoform X1 [Ischnura elegans]|uniref:uncharacterized protein LOC124168160 isoform X1 n=1 Tax=Ischnura elegans TaxID=197161 RepID=UPI001ED87B61|nr:uncharacterized protein LOC124168160 isoform X1 [Ischnura elegans]